MTIPMMVGFLRLSLRGSGLDLSRFPKHYMTTRVTLEV